jgi:hypothetical protein
VNEPRIDDSSRAVGGKLCSGPRHWWLGPLFVFAISRLLLFAVVYAGLCIRPANPQWVGHNYENIPGNVYRPDLYEGVPMVVTGFSHWDATWYESIWQKGYSYELTNTRKYNVNFFPAYPLAVRALLAATGATDRPGWHALYAEILSNVFFLGGLLLLYRLALDLGETPRVALLATLLAAFQPASVFFSAPYTESMFFLLAAATLLAAHSRHWAVAGLCGMLCSATRVTGVMLAPAVGLMWLANEGVTWRALIGRRTFDDMLHTLCRKRSWLWVLLIPCGLLAYMVYLKLAFGDALAFVHSQKQWSNITPRGFWVVIPRDIMLAVTHAAPLMKLNIAAFFVMLVASIAAWKRYGAGMGLFCLGCLLMPAMATTSSMLRYVAILVPAFVAGAYYLNKWKLGYVAVALLGAGSCVAAYAFTHVYFVG